MDTKGNGSKGLQPSFTPMGIWAISIGTSIGWGSFIVTCNAYLMKSGILGTIFGLLAGMVVILVVTWNLQHMIQHSPNAGGIYTFERKIGGKDLGFLAAWFILLTYMAILWANITSLPLFARFFLGDAFQFGFHYQIFGYDVWFGEALLSICAVLLIGILCSRSSRLPNYIMIAAALIFAVGFTVCAVIAMVRHGNTFSYSPLYADDSNAFGQIVRIAVISPWAFIGFENVAHFSEEYRFKVKKIKRILILSVVITTLLYLFVSLLSISAYPPEYESWLDYIKDMGNLSGIKAVPAFYAANHYLGQPGVTVLMCALFGVILTSLIGNMMALSRLLYAGGREGDAPKFFKKLNKKGIPHNAFYAIIIISVLIPFLGRTAIGWIVDVTTIGATIIYGLISYGVFSYARANNQKRELVTGIVGVALMGIFLLLLLIPGILPFHAIETESYILFIIWSVLGLIYFRVLIRRDKSHGSGQRIVVWVLLLVLMLLASMMWVTRETEKAANEAVERIYEYHQSHPDPDPDSEAEEERAAFLQEQANHVTQTNTLFALVSVGLFIVSISMILNNYRDAQKLGQQLTAAEEAAESARKIAELRASMTALLNNMPGMSFSKDAETGAYVACNKAFAEYAHKASPDECIGLTDDELFDPETSRHFHDEDKVVLSMEEPYIYFEDTRDAEGNQKQLQTIKLKYTDDNGRLCILGVCEDVTEMLRIQREYAMTKEAYEKARSTGIIYTHIAKTLAHGYSDLFYVNLETEEYTEYQTGDAVDSLTEARRGENFFDSCKVDAKIYLYPDDQGAFIKAMERDTLLDALRKNNVFIMTYRLLTEQGSRYVTMRVSRMEDDERFLVIGVSDVDEQMKQRRAAEQMEEERTAYVRLNALVGEFISVCIVDPESGNYREFSAAEGFKHLALPEKGTDYFKITKDELQKIIYPEDQGRFLSVFSKENILAEIERSGIFSLSFRLFIDGEPTYVQMKAALVEEKEGLRLIVGINDIDANVRQEEEYARRLAQAQSRASIDALTGVKNRHAYLDAEEKLDQRIAENRDTKFAVVILDVNDLKIVNDRDGHKAGDQYLKDACSVICDTFKHSPVFRIGGDEFAVISEGRDYERIDELMEKMQAHNKAAKANGGVVIACGMSKFENDAYTAPVFERADLNMYEDKSRLKAGSPS